MNWNRILSGLLAALYVVGGYMDAGVELAWKVAVGVVLPLACIWFADEMGSYIGSTSSVAITSPTPGWLVCIGGWLVLLLPVFIGIAYAVWGSGA